MKSDVRTVPHPASKPVTWEMPGGFSSPGYFAPGLAQTSYRDTLDRGQMVDKVGIEPTHSCLQGRCSPS